MNIAAEKEEIIKRFKLVTDVSLIKAFKNLLDSGLGKQPGTHNDALQASVERGLAQSNNREVRPHEAVWAEIRNRYKE